MPTIIGGKADAGQIEEHLREAQLNGLARGGDIAAAAEARLGAAISDIDAAARKAAVAEAARLRAALTLRQGDAVVFAVHHRPVQGTRGVYRVKLRQGVRRLRPR